MNWSSPCPLKDWVMIPRIRVLIVDDEEPARQKLRIFLAGEADFEVIAEAKNGQEALALIDETNPDVVFLDIQMPKLDGLAVASNLDNNRHTRIVFVTGFNEYAIKAFELNAVDYLLKPYDKGRLNKTLDRIRDRKQNHAPYSISKLVRDYRSEQSYPQQLLFKTENSIEVVRADDIEWVETCANYVKVCLNDNVIIARQTLTMLQSQLDPAKFVRIHRSHIINMKALKKVSPLSRGDYKLLLNDGTRLRLSRSYRENFFSILQPG